MTKLYKVAAVVFFAMGLLAAPIMGASESTTAIYKLALYILASGVFWIWLYRDATDRGVSVGNQIFIGVAGLFAVVLVAPIYLLVSRGWHNGSLAALAFFGLVLAFFSALGLGMFFSVQIANALHI